MSTLLCTIAATFCAGTIGLHAQNPTPQAPDARASATNAAPVIVIGCITREQAGPAARGRGLSANARLILTDTRSDPSSLYRLEGDQAALALHVGHTAEIVGAVSTGPTEGRGATANARTLKVQSLIWISTSCPQLKTQGD